MQNERQFVKRVDIGNDCVIVYRVGDKTELVIATRNNGDAEIFLDDDLCREVIAALGDAVKKPVV